MKLSLGAFTSLKKSKERPSAAQSPRDRLSAEIKRYIMTAMKIRCSGGNAMNKNFRFKANSPKDIWSFKPLVPRRNVFLVRQDLSARPHVHS